MARIAALALALLVSTPGAVPAESIDRLLREAGSYLERGSCDSARQVLTEVSADELPDVGLLLMGRVGRCLDDPGLVIDALSRLEEGDGADPVAAELRVWLDEVTEARQTDLDERLAAGDCDAAGKALRLLAEVDPRPRKVELALLAACQGRHGEVSKLLSELEPEERGDPRIGALEAFAASGVVDGTESFDEALQERDCDAAEQHLERLIGIDGRPRNVEGALVAACRGQVRDLERMLGGLTPEEQADPRVAALDGFVQGDRTVARQSFDEALAARDCDAAHRQLDRITALDQRPSRVDQGLVAACRGDHLGVEDLLGELSADERADPRLEALEGFVQRGYAGAWEAFDEALGSGRCDEADDALELLGSGAEAHPLNRARLAWCREDVSEVIALLQEPEIEENEGPEAAFLRSWVIEGSVPMDLVVESTEGVVHRAKIRRGETAEEVVGVAVEVPPFRARVRLDLSIPEGHDPREAYVVQLDTTRHPVAMTWHQLEQAREAAKPVAGGAAIAAAIAGGFLAWGGVEVGLAGAAADEANALDEASDKERFLELQEYVDRALPRIGIAFGGAAVGLAVSIAIPAGSPARMGRVREARRAWLAASEEPADWRELTR